MKRLEEEYRSADELLPHVVALQVRRTLPRCPDPPTAAGPSEAVEVARHDAFRRVLRWQVPHRSPLGLVARQAVADAVTAHLIRADSPDEAARLERPWRSAMDVRLRLHVLGSNAEGTALRMMQSWRLPLVDLPDAVSALTASATTPAAAGLAPESPAGPAGARTMTSAAESPDSWYVASCWSSGQVAAAHDA